MAWFCWKRPTAELTKTPEPGLAIEQLPVSLELAEDEEQARGMTETGAVKIRRPDREWRDAIPGHIPDLPGGDMARQGALGRRGGQKSPDRRPCPSYSEDLCIEYAVHRFLTECGYTVNGIESPHPSR